LPPPDTPLVRGLRRTAFVPLVFAVAAITLALFPFALLAAAAFDLTRSRRWALTRLLLLLQADALLEAAALIRAGINWLRHAPRWSSPGYRAANYDLGRWWASTLIDVARRIYDLRFEPEGLECTREGPFLLFPRHVSIADTILPIALIARRTGLRPRYVLKRELELDPVLDIVGHRVPSAFVERRGRDPAGDRARVADLGRGLGAGDFVVLFPEGTRFSPGKRRRLVEKAEQTHDGVLAMRVARFERTLPPRTGGPLALLAAAPGVDVVFLAHAGLEGSLHMSDLLDGAIIGRVVRLRAWRVPAAEIPEGEAARARWLDDQWAEIDAWLAAREE